MSSKEDQVQRHLRALKKLKSRDERRLIDENRKRRQRERSRQAPRRRDWSELDPDELADGELDEAMRPASATDLSGARKIEMPDLTPAGLESERGLVVAPRGRRMRVALAHAEVDVEVPAKLAGVDFAPGDEVGVVTPQPEVYRLATRYPRRSLLERRDPGHAHTSRAIAANVDVGVIVIAAGSDALRTGIVDRLWIALAAGAVTPLLAMNKIDRCDEPALRDAVREVGDTFRPAGLEVLEVSAVTGVGVDGLRAALAGRVAVFVGQSGVGKSSLLNALDPQGGRHVKEVRDGDDKGRHTTTASTLRSLGDGTRLIDTPGVRAFGLIDVGLEEVLAAFPDLVELAEGCRHGDCAHAGEPDCAVAAAAAGDPRLAARHRAYLRLRGNL